MKKRNNITLLKIMNEPLYRGKHVILVAGKVYTANTGKQANKILDLLEKKYPKETPAITYIPKTDTLYL